MTDLVFKLARTAVISGHVSDEDGEPVPQAEVMTYRASKKPGNEERNDDQVTTNDLGEFRVFDLSPGRYYIAINYRREGPHRMSTAPESKPEPGYLPSYYPNTTDTSKAEAISVGPGDEIRGVAFLRPSHMVTVSGRVISAQAVAPSAWGTISLRPRGSGLAQALHGINDNFQMKDGNFVIPNVPPGSYVLAANWMDRETREMHTARRQLDVGNSDLEGVTLMISRALIFPAGSSSKERLPVILMTSSSVWRPSGMKSLEFLANRQSRTARFGSRIFLKVPTGPPFLHGACMVSSS